MRRQAALATLACSALIVHACALPHYGIDPSLDQGTAAQGGAGAPAETPADTAGSGNGGENGVAGAPDMPVTAAEGTPCADNGQLACKGTAQAERLVCVRGTWQAGDTCADQQNCDQSSGLCQPIIEQCAGGTGGQRFCGEDLTLVECGPDLVTTSVVDTCDKCVATGTTAECAPTGCGDRVREAPEQCDDGNDDDTDDCTSACKVAHCGDTAIWSGHETCDDGNTVTEVCDYGKKSCTVCSRECQEVAGAASYCGDGRWQKDQEECDPDWDATANSCTQDCVSTTWCLWPLPQVAPGASNYGYTTDTVVDQTTGLTWQREADLTDRTWEEAKTYCQGLTAGVDNHWRLPTRIELMSIIDYSIADPGPTIGTAFKNATADTFWTSSEASTENAFYAGFSFGNINQQVKTWKYKARCVHS